MKDAVIYAKYNQEGDKVIYDILSKMSNDEREQDRGSYFKSLSSLLRHVLGGTLYFLGMFKTALSGSEKASKALDALPSMPGEGQLNDEQWKEFGKILEAVDAAYVMMTESLGEADLKLPVKLDWYGGNPDSVPLSFMLSQLLVHNTHHRGQISQILDSLKIENDFSGIGIAFL